MNNIPCRKKQLSSGQFVGPKWWMEHVYIVAPPNHSNLHAKINFSGNLGLFRDIAKPASGWFLVLLVSDDEFLPSACTQGLWSTETWSQEEPGATSSMLLLQRWDPHLCSRKIGCVDVVVVGWGVCFSIKEMWSRFFFFLPHSLHAGNRLISVCYSLLGFLPTSGVSPWSFCVSRLSPSPVRDLHALNLHQPCRNEWVPVHAITDVTGGKLQCAARVRHLSVKNGNTAEIWKNIYI